MPNNENYNWYQSCERLIRYKLFIPLKRSKQPPQHASRGVAVGMFWAMTPFFGAQMFLVFVTWLFFSKLMRWDFALIPGLAWTWITNIFTLLPFFYAFYLTGLLVMGDIGNAGGYGVFVSIFENSTQNADAGIWDRLVAWVNVFISEIGIPFSIGSAIWAVGGAWLSYWLSMRFIVQYRKRREENQQTNAVV